MEKEPNNVRNRQAKGFTESDTETESSDGNSSKVLPKRKRNVPKKARTKPDYTTQDDALLDNDGVLRDVVQMFIR